MRKMICSSYAKWYGATMRTATEGDMEQLCKQPWKQLWKRLLKQLRKQLWEQSWKRCEAATKRNEGPNFFGKKQYKHDQINWFQHYQQITKIASISRASILFVWKRKSIFTVWRSYLLIFFAWTLNSEKRQPFCKRLYLILTFCIKDDYFLPWWTANAM